MPFIKGSVTYARFRLGGDAPARIDETALAALSAGVLSPTIGVPVEVEGLSRIRHLSKGRYSGSATGSSLRSSVRRVQDWFRHPG